MDPHTVALVLAVVLAGAAFFVRLESGRLGRLARPHFEILVIGWVAVSFSLSRLLGTTPVVAIALATVTAAFGALLPEVSRAVWASTTRAAGTAAGWATNALWKYGPPVALVLGLAALIASPDPRMRALGENILALVVLIGIAWFFLRKKGK